MVMSSELRRLALTAHISASLGWFGAVLAFTALAVVGFTSADSRQVQAAYVAMEIVGWLVVVPLAFLAPLTGLVQSLGTGWGLTRHYWVLIKALITIACTTILLLHMVPTSRLADVAAQGAWSTPEFSALRVQLVADSVVASIVLLIATSLAVFKPRGMTTAAMPRWVKAFAAVTGSLLLSFLVVHVIGAGLGTHAGH